MPQPPHDHEFDERPDEPSDALDIPFGPPTVPIDVTCIHCGESYVSSKMEIRNEGPEGTLAWCCPTDECDGVGFLFDVWPVDPEWRDEFGNLVVCVAESADEDFEFEGVVDRPILDAYWTDDHKRSLPRLDAPDELVIDFNGDAEVPLIRLFGEPARPDVRHDDIPF